MAKISLKSAVNRAFSHHFQLSPWRPACSQPAHDSLSVITGAFQAARPALMLTLSSAATALLEVLQFRCGVSVDFVDAALQPVPSMPADDFAGPLSEPGVRELCLAALRTGEAREHRELAVPLGLYPVRRDGQVVGLLIIARRGGSRALLAEDEYRHIDTVGQIARATVENDLATVALASSAGDRARRAQAILRFIIQLTARHGERRMMHSVVQAATVWFDLDCRIYYRDIDGDFTLFEALPDIDPGAAAARLEVGQLKDAAAIRRIFSSAEPDLTDWPSRRAEVLVVPVGEAPDWVMLLNGAIAPDVELTFFAIAHTLSGELAKAARRRHDRWEEQLRGYMLDAARAPDRVLALMLNDLGTSVSAAGARLSVGHGDEQRTVAAGGAAASGASGETPPFVRVFRLGLETHARLEVWGRGERLAFDDGAIVEAWIAAVQPWLSGGALQRAEYESVNQRMDEVDFERRVQEEVERAKRFDLGLSLVLVDATTLNLPEGVPRTAVVDALRSELRASDIMGPVRGGLIGVLLVQTAPTAARSVAGRTRRKLAPLVETNSRIRVGESAFSPACPSADALIAQASRDLEGPTNVPARRTDSAR